MEYKELAKLDSEISEAHAKLVSLNNEYNNLLTSIYNSKNNKKQVPVAFVSEKERKYDKIRRRIRLFYWLVFIGNLLANSFLELPNGLYSSILFGDVFFYFVGSITCGVKIAKERVNNEGKEIDSDNTNTNKDELYEKMCQARERYHSLRKKREDVLIDDNDPDYQEYLEHVDQIINGNSEMTFGEQNETKTLSLDKN